MKGKLADQKIPLYFSKRGSMTKTKSQARGGGLLTLGACGVFGF